MLRYLRCAVCIGMGLIILLVPMLPSTTVHSLSLSQEEIPMPSFHTVDPLGPRQESTGTDMSEVAVTGGFWGSYQKLMICETIPHMIEQTERIGHYSNILNAARKNRGESYEPFVGWSADDSFVYEAVESMAWALMIDAQGDADILAAQADIRRKLDEWIPVMVDSQTDDGYLGTYWVLEANPTGTPRMYDFASGHELYNMGIYYEAAIAVHRATGNDAMLKAALKNVDFLTSVIGDGDGQIRAESGHPEIEVALLRLADYCDTLGSYQPPSRALDCFNSLTFTPVTADRIRFVMETSAKPGGLRELRVKTADGQYVEQQATATASYSQLPWSPPTAANNGQPVDSSTTSTEDKWTPYPETGTQWLEYAFDQPLTFTQAEAYFLYVDGAVDVPDAWTMQYYDDDTASWLEVGHSTDYSVYANKCRGMVTWFLDNRGQNRDWHGTALSNYHAGGKPLSDLTVDDLSGQHTDRAAYLYQAMADWGKLNGDTKYDDLLRALYNEVVSTRSYVTGVGGQDEIWLQADTLPNNTDRSGETCSAMTLIYWAKSMHQLFGDSAYYDTVEQALYNATLSQIDLDGNAFFYYQPTQSSGAKRPNWQSCPCCAMNYLRLLSTFGKYLYTTTDDSILVNMYVSSDASLTLGDTAVNLSMLSSMPWSGDASLTLALETNAAFTLKLRLPGWVTGEASVTVNGTAISAIADNKGYIVIDRTWSDGDVVTVNFPMDAFRVYTPDVTANAGLVAVQRGPVVYCAEAEDNPHMPLDTVYLPADAPLTVGDAASLADGIGLYGTEIMRTITTQAKVKGLSGDSDQTLTLIPYYAWANRKEGAMRIFLHETPPTLSLMAYAKPAASLTGEAWYTSIGNLCDGISSPQNYWCSWLSSKVEKNPWVELSFDAPVILWGSEIVWMDDGDQTQIPDVAVFQYWDGEKYVDIASFDRFEKNTPNGNVSGYTPTVHRFTPVSTTRLRILINNTEKERAVGIFDWKVLGSTDKNADMGLTGIRYGTEAPVAWDGYNTLSFAPITASRIRFYMETSDRPAGLCELRVKTDDGEYVERQATVTATGTGVWASLDAVNNGKVTGNGSLSGDVSDRWSNWPNIGPQWVEYTFDQAFTFVQADAYFVRFANDPVAGGHKLPDFWTMQYYDEAADAWVDCNPRHSLTGFDPAITQYEVVLPAGYEAPLTVWGETAVDYAVVKVTQPTSLPGFAVITLTSPENGQVLSTYRIHFRVEQEKPETPSSLPDEIHEESTESDGANPPREESAESDKSNPSTGYKPYAMTGSILLMVSGGVILFLSKKKKHT